MWIGISSGGVTRQKLEDSRISSKGKATYVVAGVGVAEAADNSAKAGRPAAETDALKGCSTRSGAVM
jgi:hypothetical protein